MMNLELTEENEFHAETGKADHRSLSPAAAVSVKIEAKG
jgi:hypothetical protein